MSHVLKGNSALQHIKCSKTIKIHNKITFNFNLRLPHGRVGGVSCTRKMAPVGEGWAKVVTPLTDIQLLQPVIVIMLGRGDRRG